MLPSSFIDISNLRRTVLKKRDNLSSSQLITLSRFIASRLKKLSFYEQSRFPLFYASFRSEVFTHELIKERLNEGLAVALPLTKKRTGTLETYLIEKWEDMAPGAYGILEPKPEKNLKLDPALIDLVIVPGSVFDKKCFRYGYGGGYYDRFLATDASQALRVGLCFELQLQRAIPVQPHDQRMDVIITESQTITCMQDS